MHTTECVETVYELSLLTNKLPVQHFYINRKRCAALTGCLPLGCRPDGDWSNT